MRDVQGILTIAVFTGVSLVVVQSKRTVCVEGEGEAKADGGKSLFLWWAGRSWIWPWFFHNGRGRVRQ